MYFLNKVGLLTHSSVLIIWRLFNPYKDVKFQFVISCSERFISISDFASLVKYYKPLEIELINEKRDFDNLEQSVNRDIYLVPLSYTSVEDGVKKIFDERKGKDMSY